MKISATIITFNEAENIRSACESVSFADEIIVVDSGSTDKTREIAVSCGANVLIQDWLGFARQKQFAAENAANNWIFSLDADERVSPELAQEILKLKGLPEEKLADGYRIARKNFYMNRWIRGGGWYPDWQLRFYNRRKAVWKDVLIHESVQLNSYARLEYLRGGDIIHRSVENAAYHHRLIGERYAPLAARQMFENGRRTTPFKIATAGFAVFFQTYFLKAGFRDGLPGFCIARFAAHHAFLKHLLLWEMQEKSKEVSPESRVKRKNKTPGSG
ncbi:MAG: glycosyltransferase family 2 protein [Acidobacteriota bacterium]|nr:glycosyltransferase family 2 protein [Acidobacteriota bacterium]